MKNLSFTFLIFVLLCSCSPETQDIPEEIKKLKNVEIYPADVETDNDIRFVCDITLQNGSQKSS